MKWYAQLIHVARKDLYLTRWLIAGYAAVVAALTAGVADGSVLAPLTFFPWSLALILLGMILLAMLVQADSPARTTAFWVTLPLHPAAVMAAKILVALVVLVGLGLIGQFVGLLAHDVAARDLPGLLAKSVLEYGTWLLWAAVIAALTRDLRTFMVALTLLTIGWFLGGMALRAVVNPEPAPWPREGSPPLLASVALAGGMLLLLAHQYLTRNLRRGVWIAGLLAVVSLLLPLAAPRTAATAAPAAGPVPDELRAARLSLEPARDYQESPPAPMLRLDGASEFHQYALVSPVAHLHLPDGSSERVPVTRPFAHLWLNLPTPRLAGELRWLGPRTQPDGISQISRRAPLEVSLSQQEALARGEARLVLQGHLEVWGPRVMAELPLARGATAVGEGRRVRIAGVERSAAGLSLALRTSTVFSSRSPPERRFADLPGQHLFAYALVNRDRGEALPLTQMGGGGSDLALVLPGPNTWTRTVQLGVRPHHPETSELQRDEEWLRGARLLLIQWEPLGSYPVTLEMDGRGTDRFGGVP